MLDYRKKIEKTFSKTFSRVLFYFYF